MEPALTQQLISLAHTQVYSEEADTPDDWESAYDDEGNRLEPPPSVEPCVSQGLSLVPATPPPPPAVASAVELSEQNTALLIVEPPRQARLPKHRHVRHQLLRNSHIRYRMEPKVASEHRRHLNDLVHAAFAFEEFVTPPQPSRRYDDEFLSPRMSLQQGRLLRVPREERGVTVKKKRAALRAAAATDAHLGVDERVDERDGAEFGLRGCADDDAYFAVQEHDNVFGDTIVASRREPCATPSLAKLEFEALVSQRPVSPKSLLELSLEASTPAPRHEQASKLHVGSAVPAATEPPVTKPMDELATTPHHVQLAATRLQACYRGTLARGKARWDPVWVVVWPESSTRREGKTLMVPDDAVELQFHYYHARLQHVFEFLIERLGMGSEATHLLRSAAGRALSDLGQTLYEANLRRCIEGVRGRGGLYLELCPIGLVSKKATAVQLASDEKMQSATTPTSPSEPPAEQPTTDSVDELAATPSQYAMVVEESRELAAELAVAAGSEEEVADIGAALEVDLGITPGDLERLAMAESEDEAALRTGVERSLAQAVDLSAVVAPKPTPALAANTPLWPAIGCRIVNNEPRVGGMCMIASLLESQIAKEDYLHRLLDHLVHDAHAAGTVDSYHVFAEKEIKMYKLRSLSHALRRVYGVSDVVTFVEELREPIGYQHGARQMAPLSGPVLFAAASNMKMDIVVLDASTATPLNAVVRHPSLHLRASGDSHARAFANLTSCGACV